MDDDALLRYSRHLLLPEWGAAEQARVRAARVLLIGLGGLGSPAALYLAAAGVGRLILCDGDTVDLSNLQRQIVHRQSSLGMSKVDSAALSLQDLNPEVELLRHPHAADAAWLASILPSVDLVLDGSDNFATRDRVNLACVRAGVPLVSAAAIAWEGQIGVFGLADGPCYRCLYPDLAGADLRCADNGVFAPLVGVMGAMMAQEALKLLSQAAPTLAGRFLVYDARQGEVRVLRVKRDPQCTGCAQERQG